MEINSASLQLVGGRDGLAKLCSEAALAAAGDFLSFFKWKEAVVFGWMVKLVVFVLVLRTICSWYCCCAKHELCGVFYDSELLVVELLPVQDLICIYFSYTKPFSFEFTNSCWAKDAIPLCIVWWSVCIGMSLFDIFLHIIWIWSCGLCPVSQPCQSTSQPLSFPNVSRYFHQSVSQVPCVNVKATINVAVTWSMMTWTRLYPCWS